jgi:hypothetical protein
MRKRKGTVRLSVDKEEKMGRLFRMAAGRWAMDDGHAQMDDGWTMDGRCTVGPLWRGV